METKDILAELAMLKLQLAALSQPVAVVYDEPAGDVPMSSGEVNPPVQGVVRSKAGVQKNKCSVNPKPGRSYVRLGELSTNGRVPQQQADLAKIVIAHTSVGVPISEAALFGHIEEDAARYASLNNSVQSATYLFCYYRGLDKRDGKHMGFIRRNFLQMKES